MPETPDTTAQPTPTTAAVDVGDNPVATVPVADPNLAIIAKLQETVDALIKERDDLHSDNVRLGGKVSDLTTQVATLTESNEKRSGEVTAAAKEIDGLKIDLSDQEKNLTAVIDEATKANTELDGEIKAQAAIIEGLNAKLTATSGPGPLTPVGTFPDTLDGAITSLVNGAPLSPAQRLLIQGVIKGAAAMTIHAAKMEEVVYTYANDYAAVIESIDQARGLAQQRFGYSVTFDFDKSFNDRRTLASQLKNNTNIVAMLTAAAKVVTAFI